jgi:hypothetical protein
MLKSFVSQYAPGEWVYVADDIKGYIVRVSFTVGRDFPKYTVEWFNNGTLEQGDFFPDQIKGKANG